MNEQPFRAVNNLRKSGKLQEAWNVGFAALEQTPHDVYLKGSLFWVCYEYLKQKQEKVATRATTSGNYRPSDFEFEQIENLLQTIAGLEIPTGGLEYKMLLVQFRKNIEWFPSLIHMVLDKQGTIFDDESKQPFQAEKGEVPSLMLSITRQVASAWLRAREYWQIDLQQVMSLITLTRSHVKDTKHIIWLDYDQAKCFIVSGDYGKARELILPILRKKQRESWAWGALAATYQKESPDLATMFFAKGIDSAHDVTFALKLLQGIVPLFLNAGQPDKASMCVKLAVGAYKENGWKVKPELEKLQAQQWYYSSVDETLLMTYLKSVSKDATNHLHGPLQFINGVVESIHRSGKGFNVFVNKSTLMSVRIGAHQGKVKPKPGDYVELSISQNEEREVVSCKCIDKVEINDVSFTEGELRIAPKGFGFVNDTFVPPYIINSIENQSQVKVMQVLSWDKTKSRYSQKAVSIRLDNA